MSRAASRLALAVSLAGCGGPELLVDTTPPVLIPNGGSAQAGQVEGPTAIPVTGAGAIVAIADPDPPPAPPPGPLSVIDAAALEATGATAPPAVDGAREDVDEEASNGAGDGADDADDEEGAEGVGAAATAPAPEPPPSASAPLPVTPTTRRVVGPGYSLAIPAAWEDLDPAGLGSIFITSANRSMDPGDGFYANVIVSSEPFEGDTQAYAVLSLSPMLEGGARLVGSDTTGPGRTHRGHVDVEAHWINVTGVPYVTLQRYLTTGEAGYVITCAAAAATFEEHRDTCIDVFESMVVHTGP